MPKLIVPSIAKSTGRPPLVDLSREDRAKLRALYLRTNRARGKGSKTLAARLAATRGEVSEAVRQAILYRGADPEQGPRATKHDITHSIRRAMDIPPRMFVRYRDERAAELAGLYAPGRLRRTDDGSRMLYAGERINWDDGTENVVLWIPWPYGGDPCSDRYGVRVGRYQILAGTDDRSDYCAGFSFVVRPTASYRQRDQAAAIVRHFRDVAVPDEIVLEGNWDTNPRLVKLCEMAGTRIRSARGRPHLKLIESWWSRLWSATSPLDGHVGRYRGEHRDTTELYLRCRRGAVDPREHFLSLSDFLNALEQARDYLNQTPVESPEYGRWIPAEVWKRDLEEHPRGVLDMDVWHLVAPEIAVRTVGKGMVKARAHSPTCEPHTYCFASPELWKLEGRRVSVHFDPWMEIPRATLVAVEDFCDWRAGDTIDRRAECIGTHPVVSRSSGTWEAFLGYGAAADAKRAQSQSVRTEYRVLTQDGRRVAESEALTPAGAERRIEHGAEIGAALVADARAIGGDGAEVLPAAGGAPAAALPRIRGRFDLVEEGAR